MLPVVGCLGRMLGRLGDNFEHRDMRKKMTGNQKRKRVGEKEVIASNVRTQKYHYKQPPLIYSLIHMPSV